MRADFKFVLFAFFLFAAWTIQAQAAEIKTGTANLVTRVAPGELLPVSVKLVNFGGGQRVDVTIDYFILNEEGKIMLSEKETVAVETTANFVKILQIPRDLPPGHYTAESSIVYQGQKVPATAGYQFIIERKIAGIFLSQFIIYGSIVLLIIFGASALGRLIKKNRLSRLVLHEYKNISKENRIFYEIVSDIIAQMRQRVGDEAIVIAKNIDDLELDPDSGRIINIRKSPAKIIALLILKYEKLLGQKINFSFRKSGETSKEHLESVDKNLIVIRKYFE